MARAVGGIASERDIPDDAGSRFPDKEAGNFQTLPGSTSNSSFHSLRFHLRQSCGKSGYLHHLECILRCIHSINE